MREIALAVVLANSSASAQGAPRSEDLVSVKASNGRIIGQDATGRLFSITEGPADRDPVSSSDGATVAFVRVERWASPDESEDERDYTSLWAWSRATGARNLVSSEAEVESPEGSIHLRGMKRLRISLNGGFVYVMSCQSAVTTSCIVQVN